MVRHRSLVMLCVVGILAASGRGTGAAGRLDDATILAIYDQANTADILTARLAVKYGASEEVRALGRMVAADHVAVQQMGRDLASKLGVIPTPPDGDTSIMDSARAVTMLQSKRGAEFDRAYLQHEVAFHQAVVDAIRGTLLPAASNPELRALMTTVLAGFEHHLAATKTAAAKMGVK
jgi:putative membrane protein